MNDWQSLFASGQYAVLSLLALPKRILMYAKCDMMSKLSLAGCFICAATIAAVCVCVLDPPPCGTQ